MPFAAKSGLLGDVEGALDAVRQRFRVAELRALVKMNAELTTLLRQAGLMTRDPRIKERKKPGLKRARKAPTYTKR